MRLVVFLCLFLVVFFAAHGVYQRAQCDRLLSVAVAGLPDNPLGAWGKLQPVEEYNSLLTLGKIGAVESEFRDKMRDSVIDDLTADPPGDQAVGQALDAVAAFKRMNAESQTRGDEACSEIIRAMHAAVPSIRDRGTLEAWDRTVLFFQNVAADAYWPSDLPGDAGAWVAELEAVPRRQVALRDQAMRAAARMAEGLVSVGVSYDAAGATLAEPMPANIPDGRLYDADMALTRALGDLDRFDKLFPKAVNPPEYNALRAAILYNRAAVKIGHAQDKGATLRSEYSGYLTRLWVREDTLATPSPAVLYSLLAQSVNDDLSQASSLFSQARTMNDEKRRAYYGAAQNTLALFKKGVQPINPNRILPAGSTESGGASSLAGLETLTRSGGRVMLLTTLP